MSVRGAGRWRRAGLAALVIGSILVAFAGVEVVARVLFRHWGPEDAQVTRFWQHDPRYGWSHVPGVTGRFRRDGFDVTVAINGKGYRGREVAYEADQAQRRVLLLGDSFAWGFGVDYEATFASRLETLIDGIEVVNLGVSGYGTDQELLLYRDEGRRYRPDVVLLTVADNDLTSNLRTIESVIYGKPAFVLENDALVLVNHPVPPPSRLRRAAVRFAAHSYVLNQLHRVREWGEIARMRADGGERVGAFPASPGEVITSRLLLELNAAVAADGARLLVVFVSGIPVAHEATAFLARHQVASVILDDHLDSRDPRLHLDDRFHWSAEGHAVVAEVLADRLRAMLGRAAATVAAEGR